MKLYLLLLTLCLFSCKNQQSVPESYKLLYTDEQPAGDFSVSVYFQESISFGPHFVKIYGIPQHGNIEKQELLLTRKIYNDGVALRQGNAFVEWLNDGTGKLYLRGEEQEREIYTISYKNQKFEIEQME